MKTLSYFCFIVILNLNFIYGVQNTEIGQCLKIMNTAKVKTEKVAICLQLCMNYREALSKKLVIKTLKDSCNLVLDKKNNLIPYKKNFNESKF